MKGIVSRFRRRYARSGDTTALRRHAIEKAASSNYTSAARVTSCVLVYHIEFQGSDNAFSLKPTGNIRWGLLLRFLFSKMGPSIRELQVPYRTRCMDSNQPCKTGSGNSRPIDAKHTSDTAQMHNCFPSQSTY
ncbi:hypothetical protein FOCG_09414 [Fusarium oxysporum f. sp. radicis-lycopersici 26381]|uniref:Uncharacterized protein n=1 Tax=Fusarium oxysporum Fo47 TaxID=660027 RepID=W9K673_FUSOX|nr:hypothetical protein FOZG_08824 [Fusarium oxysporum Fo47]EWZ88006.1 hypothetical protein FOWG_09635 [Fusarium oxysporum f. sp. lycopersici MN25]EXL51442.1 hypothetical protein FOCG_09414 [Fusarium oxysporum f. sp. radicis-lycopersici 26381]EWZ39892.1 hypothetical protein FOZG_08824 [Fusarium oxysporum Fo47]EWZ88007.1 hypothetical protein FOWG_09635 [Fusarium oxysporum f. sp. lycopersici MN25]